MATLPEKPDREPDPTPPAEAGTGAARRPISLPAARNRDRLEAAITAIRERGLSLERASEEFGVDPEQLHRWRRRASESHGDVPGAGSEQPVPEAQPVEGDVPPQPRNMRINPSQLADDQRDQFAQNWDTATSGIEPERQLSHFEAALERFPPLAWFLGTDLRRLGTALLCGLLLVTGIIYLAREQPEDPPPTSDSAGQEPAIVTLPDQDDHTQAIAAARAYLAADSIEEKLQHVMSPDRVRPLAEEWYARPENSGALSPITETEVRNAIGILLHGHRISVIELAAGDQTLAIPVVMFEDGDPKIEWESAVAYSAISWASFASKRSPEPVTFRVTCAPADYYNAPFDDDKTFVAYRLVPPRVDTSAPPHQPLYGYARRGGVVAQYLYSLGRRSAGKTNIILKLRFPPGAFRDCVEILGVESESWISIPKEPST